MAFIFATLAAFSAVPGHGQVMVQVAGAGNVQALQLAGVPAPTETVMASVSAPVGSCVSMIVGTVMVPKVLSNGMTLHVLPASVLGVHTVLADIGGAAHFAFTLPAGFPSDQFFVCQACIVDPNGMLSLTNPATMLTRDSLPQGAPLGIPTVATPSSPTNAAQVQIQGIASAAGSTIEIAGHDSVVSVIANGGASGTAFSAVVPLASNQLNTFFVTEVFGAGVVSAPVAVNVIQDSTGPTLFVDGPSDGDTTLASFVTVFGRVADTHSGNAGLSVTVNGGAAIVNPGIGTNGTYSLGNVSLNAVGVPTVITVQGSDAVGNMTTKTTTVTRVAPMAGASVLSAVSGNDQVGMVGDVLSQPVRVRVEHADGSAFVNKIVNFVVTRSNGTLATSPQDPGVPSLNVATDGSGFAQVWWRLGADAGVGNNRVRASSSGVSGIVTFCATGLAQSASQINVGSGDNQKAQTTSPLLLPLVARVTDGQNPIAGVAVTFRVASGGGNFQGLPQRTVLSDLSGAATAFYSVGSNPGVNVVEADFAANTGLPASFTSLAVAAQAGTPTSFGGIVQDNGGRPLVGATCLLRLGAQNHGPVITGTDGRFEFQNIGAGAAVLFVDGRTVTSAGGVATPMGSFPPLDVANFVVVAETANSLPMPVMLPRLESANAVVYDGTHDIVLEVAGIDGLKFTIEQGSVRLPDGSVPNLPITFSLDQVHFDEIPMPLPDGVVTPFAWTFQPANLVFDPPVKVEMPNMTGLEPGSVTYFLSFDHAMSRFQIVGSGQVTLDGSMIHSDEGSGITLSGWGSPAPPPPPMEEKMNCAGLDLWALAREGGLLVANILTAIGNIQNALNCVTGLVQSTNDCVTTYNDVKADGTLTSAEVASVLGCVNSTKQALLTCANAFPDPTSLVNRAQQVSAILGSAIATAQSQSDCLSFGVNLALNVAASLNNTIGTLLNYVGQLNVKQAAAFVACATLNLIVDNLNILNTGDGTVAGGAAEIAALDGLFTQAMTQISGFAAPSPAFAAITDPSFISGVTQLGQDADAVADGLETNPELAGATVTILGRTSLANAGGGFVVRNLPRTNGLFAASVVKTDAGGTSYGRSVFFELSANAPDVVEMPIALSPNPVAVPLGLSVSPSGVQTLAPGLQLALTVTADLSNGGMMDVTARIEGTTYRSSNPAILSVDDDGEITAHLVGDAFVTVTNQGVSAVKRFFVATSQTTSSIEGFVVDPSGVPFSGANVSIPRLLLSTSSAADGSFQFSGLVLPAGQTVNVVARATIGGVPHGDSVQGLELVPDAVTDAGVLMLEVLPPVVVGYYDTALNNGASTQTAPIVTAGGIPMNVGNILTANLSSFDILFVQNPNNGGYGSAFVSAAPAIANFVAAGGVLVFHDRHVDTAENVLPGCPGVIMRDLANNAANIDVLDDTTRVTNGPGGIITNTTLDGGNLSSHGFIVEGSIPPSGSGILARPSPTELVTYSYAFGAGWVVYSSIPLDFYLAGNNPAAFRTIYAPNVVAYATDLFNGLF